MWTYRLFGLSLASQIALPELQETGSAAPDVVLEAGHLGDVGAGFLLQTDCARFLIADGRSIRVEAACDAIIEDVRLHILGSVMGVVCLQRGLLPLHAASIVAEGRAHVFAGPSGVGKSTLAAAAHRLGLTVLADDLSVISLNPEGLPQVWPGVGRVKLWPESLPGLGLEAAQLTRLTPSADKFALPLARPNTDTPEALARITLLDPGRSPNTEVHRLTGAAAAEAVLGNIYRWSMAAELGLAEAVFHRAMALVARIEVCLMDRQTALASLGALPLT